MLLSYKVMGSETNDQHIISNFYSVSLVYSLQSQVVVAVGL